MLIKKNIHLLFILLLVFSTAVIPLEATAADYKSPEDFTEYIYKNYSEENFAEVYKNFAEELKEILTEETYLNFQKENFKDYDLEFTEIEVQKAEKIDFKEIKSKFDYAEDSGQYYKLKVNYLIKFSHFGSRDKESGKSVYLQKEDSDYSLLWDYKEAIDSDKSAGDDKDD